MSNKLGNPSPSQKTAGDSFWPESIKQTKLRAPAALLREQAVALGQLTQNLVTAEVENVTSPEDGGQLVYAFEIVAPALGNYHVTIFEIVHHAVRLYPVSVRSQFLAPPGQTFKRLAANELAFKGILKNLLNAEKTIGAIQSLKAQSQA
jgi:hypothetical protein